MFSLRCNPSEHGLLFAEDRCIIYRFTRLQIALLQHPHPFFSCTTHGEISEVMRLEPQPGGFSIACSAQWRSEYKGLTVACPLSVHPLAASVPPSLPPSPFHVCLFCSASLSLLFACLPQSCPLPGTSARYLSLLRARFIIFPPHGAGLHFSGAL